MTRQSGYVPAHDSFLSTGPLRSRPAAEAERTKGGRFGGVPTLGQPTPTGHWSLHE